ncbi:MAG: flavodoxin family protein [Betaproteobacteria bacterium]|nr:flavodoxin family protein [Betaproteobacteria bacterium]
MAKTVVVFHSGYGHTQCVAQAVAKGANAQLVAIDADGHVAEADWAALDAADAIVMGSPTYMGSVSWQFKKFADASSRRWFTRAWQDKFFAGFTVSASLNGDKGSTLGYLNTLAAQHGGLWISLGMAPASSSAASRNDINHMGGSVGLLVQVPSDAGADKIPKGDLDTAFKFGERVAAVSARTRG